MNFQQRLVDLAFTAQGNTLTLQPPSNPNLMPPGHYMLFALVNGVPSIVDRIPPRPYV